MELASREKEILGLIIDQYSKVGEAVGSKTLVFNYNLKYSAATVRNVMFDLESLGLIEKAHTSAGRIPTVAGYKFYISYLLEKDRLTQRELESIKARYNDIEAYDIGKSTKILSELTKHTSLALEPSVVKEKLKKIELIYINSHSFLVVIVSDSVVKTKRIILRRAVTEEEIKNLSLHMNAVFRDQVLEDIILSDDTPLKNESFVLQSFINQLESKIYVEGAESVISHLALQNAHLDSYKIFDVKEEIKPFLEKLASQVEDDKINILLGDDLESEKLKGLSFVFSTYNRNNSKGVIGVVGPRRMEYSKVSSVVENISNHLRSLNEKKEK